MRRLALATALALLAATPSLAALKEGSKAPDFNAPGFQAGKPITFSMSEARKKGPVVLYFFPAAETAGCNLEARLFAESIDQFKAQGATVIGVRRQSRQARLLLGGHRKVLRQVPRRR